MAVRFPVASENVIQELKNTSRNENTTKSTTFWVSVWKKWCFEKALPQEIEQNEPDVLNKLLERFYAEVKTKTGDDYEPESLKVMITGLDRYLKEKGYSYSIVRDREFSSSKQVLEGKAKQLRAAGRGKRPNKARPVTNEEEEELWESGQLGNENPETLLQTIWWLLTQHFGMRGRQEHHNLKIEDFRLVRGEDAIEFVEFHEGPTKTRPGGLSVKPRQFQPRMFQTGGRRCPVALFKQYITRRPVAMRNAGPFYLSVNHKRATGDPVWFKQQPMGINKINTMMKSIVTGTSLETSDKQFSNHSARKTVVNKLKQANLERSAIAKVTGHRSLQSLDDYDEADEREQRKLSWAISSKRNTASTSASSTPQMPQFRPEFPQLPSAFHSSQLSQAQNLMNSFHNCKVTFNLNNTSPDIQPRKRRYFIDSDSD